VSSSITTTSFLLGLTDDLSLSSIVGDTIRKGPVDLDSIDKVKNLGVIITSDRTQAEIICKTEQEAGGSDAATHFTNDPLRIHQSSLIAKGWGSGNCFYMGVNGDFQTPGQHKFQCRDIGALAKSANLQLAFQYSISNIGKTCVLGDENTAENNLVKTIAKKLECTLSIGTYSAAKTSGTNWYTAKFETRIDGDGQTSKFGQWSSFIGVKDGYSSIGQNAANTDLEAGDTGVAAFVHIYLSFKDRVGARATGMREFPFDTSVTDKTLNFKTYGVGLKADATLTVTLPAADKFIASNDLAFTAWDPASPSGKGDCVTVSVGSSNAKSGLSTDAVCNTALPAICERQAVGTTSAPTRATSKS
jgi:hypothetical protein